MSSMPPMGVVLQPPHPPHLRFIPPCHSNQLKTLYVPKFRQFCIHSGPFRPFDPQSCYFKWTRPKGKYVTLNVDASVTKNRTGIGAILRGSDGEAIAALACVTRTCKNINVVELRAIWEGLYIALAMGVRYILINTDSIKAVEYVFSTPYTYPEVAECVTSIQAMLKRFDSWGCKHVYRETNKAADFLSKYASNGDVRLSRHNFPWELKEIVEKDKLGYFYLRENSAGQAQLPKEVRPEIMYRILADNRRKFLLSMRNRMLPPMRLLHHPRFHVPMAATQGVPVPLNYHLYQHVPAAQFIPRFGHCYIHPVP